MINLLPSKEKEKLKKIKKEKKQIILLSLFVFFFFCLTSFFFLTNYYWQREIEKEKVLIAEWKEHGEILKNKEEIIQINKRIKEINDFYQNKKDYSSIFITVLTKMPSSAYLESFSLGEGKVSLSGFVSAREELLIFKENLENKFDHVNFPPLNWVEKENINFFVTFSYE